MTMDDQNRDLQLNDPQSSPHNSAQPASLSAASSLDPLPISAPPEPSLSQKMFLGADGLRAGWGLLLFIILLATVLLGVFAAVRKIHPFKQPSSSEPAHFFIIILSEIVPFLCIALVTWLMSKIEGRPFRVYGLAARSAFSYLFAGLAWGVICLSLLILTLWKLGLLVFDGRLLFGPDILRYGALWLFGFLFVGLQEEFLMRGFLQYTLARGFAGLYRSAFKSPHSSALGFWTGALILSVLFGLGHKGNPGESPIGLLSAGSVGLVFCLSLWRTGSLWWAVGFHATWDWGQSFLYGVADSGTMIDRHLYATHPVGTPIMSGGLTGPEGSIFVLGALLLTVIIIMFTLPRRPHQDYAALMPHHEPTDATTPRPLGLPAEI